MEAEVPQQERRNVGDEAVCFLHNLMRGGFHEGETWQQNPLFCSPASRRSAFLLRLTFQPTCLGFSTFPHSVAEAQRREASVGGRESAASSLRAVTCRQLGRSRNVVEDDQ